MKREIRYCVICGSLDNAFEKCQRRCINCNNLQRCYLCKEVKTLDNFNKDLSKARGVSNRCRICDKIVEQGRTRVYDKEKTKEYDIRRKDHPIRKARVFLYDCFLRKYKRKEINEVEIFKYSKDEFLKKFPKIEKGYHLDHIVPMSWFKQDTPLHISCALDNLQLLTAEENMKKSNKYADKCSTAYLEKIVGFIKPEYLEKLYL